MRNNRQTKKFYLFLIFFYFFIFKDPLEQKFGLIGYADELLALLSIPLFIQDFEKKNLKIRIKHERLSAGGYGKYIVIFLLIGIISGFVFKYQTFKYSFYDLFNCVKFWLAIYVGKRIFTGFDINKYAKRIYRHIKFITLFYLVLLILDWQFHIFPASMRYGLRSTYLIYSVPTVFNACCMFVIMILLDIKESVSGYIIWLSILLFLMCTTLRSKAWASVAAILLICYFIFYRKKKFTFRTVILFIPVAIFIGWDQIAFYFFSSIQNDSARYQLLSKSISIAIDHFPFGSGFGTFASYYSGINYSPLYSIYGISSVTGLIEGRASFISDSFWPMILAQTGFLGTLMYIMAIIRLFQSIQQLRRLNICFYASGLSAICYLLISSIAESSFVHPTAIPIAVMLGYILSKK